MKTQEVKVDLGPVVVRGLVPIHIRSTSTEPPYEVEAVAGEALYQFHVRASKIVIGRHINTGPALKILRSVTRLTATAMAELLGVAKETVYRGEKSPDGVDAATWMMYMLLAHDVLEGGGTGLVHTHLQQLRVAKIIPQQENVMIEITV